MAAKGITSEQTRTFIDSSVLLAAWRGNFDLRVRALTVLSDPHRKFISSPFVRLEVRPKAVFYQTLTETAFYDTFFASVSQWVNEYKKLMAQAVRVSEKCGLNGMDALHIAAALLARANQFVITERPASPLIRVQEVEILSIT